jgi:hypothetical protein
MMTGADGGSRAAVRAFEEAGVSARLLVRTPILTSHLAENSDVWNTPQFAPIPDRVFSNLDYELPILSTNPQGQIGGGPKIFPRGSMSWRLEDGHAGHKALDGISFG